MYFLPVLNLLFVLSVHINFIISKIWHRNWKSLAQHLAFTFLFTKTSFLVTNFAEDLNFGRADPVVRRLLSLQMWCHIKMIKSQNFECPTLATWIKNIMAFMMFFQRFHLEVWSPVVSGKHKISIKALGKLVTWQRYTKHQADHHDCKAETHRDWEASVGLGSFLEIFDKSNGTNRMIKVEIGWSQGPLFVRYPRFSFYILRFATWKKWYLAGRIHQPDFFEKTLDQANPLNTWQWTRDSTGEVQRKQRKNARDVQNRSCFSV